MVGQEGRKQQEQVENREDEEVGSIAALGIAASAQPECEHNENCPADNGGSPPKLITTAPCPPPGTKSEQKHPANEEITRPRPPYSNAPPQNDAPPPAPADTNSRDRLQA